MCTGYTEFLWRYLREIYTWGNIDISVWTNIISEDGKRKSYHIFPTTESKTLIIHYLYYLSLKKKNLSWELLKCRFQSSAAAADSNSMCSWIFMLTSPSVESRANCSVPEFKSMVLFVLERVLFTDIDCQREVMLLCYPLPARSSHDLYSSKKCVQFYWI